MTGLAARARRGRSARRRGCVPAWRATTRRISEFSRRDSALRGPPRGGHYRRSMPQCEHRTQRTPHDLVRCRAEEKDVEGAPAVNADTTRSARSRSTAHNSSGVRLPMRDARVDRAPAPSHFFLDRLEPRPGHRFLIATVLEQRAACSGGRPSRWGIGDSCHGHSMTWIAVTLPFDSSAIVQA